MILALAGAPLHAAPRPLIWGADEEGGQPYIFLTPDGKRVGFEVDLANALAEELGREIEFKQYPFENLIPGLRQRDIDFAMNGLEITPERETQVRFSKPYYIYYQQLVVRSDEERLRTLKDCQTHHAVVGTMEATAAEQLLRTLGFEPVTYKAPTEAYSDLALGRTDAVLLDQPIAVAYARPDKRLKFTGRPTARGRYAIAFHPDDAELADEVDAALTRLKKNGKLRDILRKWGIWNQAQEELMEGYLFEEEDQTGGASGLGQEAASTWKPWQYLPLLGMGALWTVALTASSFVLAVLLGLPLAIMRLYGPWWLRGVATGYIEFFRGVPVMLVLFFLYFGVPAISQYYGWSFTLSLNPFWAATIGLGLNYAAYEAEIYRAGIQAIPGGQWEAAASLGMPAPLTFRRIILPQALRSILPPTTGDLVALFKDTSIASTIGLVELNKEYLILSKSSLQFVEIGLATAALYLIMSVPLGLLSRRLEQRWGRHAV
jgi:polar amino acid transport system substrate-binding protein